MTVPDQQMKKNPKRERECVKERVLKLKLMFKMIEWMDKSENSFLSAELDRIKLIN